MEKYLPFTLTGESSQVEDAGRTDGWTHHKWCSGDAPTPRLQPGLQTWPVEGNLSLW